MFVYACALNSALCTPLSNFKGREKATFMKRPRSCILKRQKQLRLRIKFEGAAFRPASSSRSCERAALKRLDTIYIGNLTKNFNFLNKKV